MDLFQELFLTADILSQWEIKLKRTVIIRSHFEKLITFCCTSQEEAISGGFSIEIQSELCEGLWAATVLGTRRPRSHRSGRGVRNLTGSSARLARCASTPRSVRNSTVRCNNGGRPREIMRAVLDKAKAGINLTWDRRKRSLI